MMSTLKTRAICDLTRPCTAKSDENREGLERRVEENLHLF